MAAASTAGTVSSAASGGGQPPTGSAVSVQGLAPSASAAAVDVAKPVVPAAATLAASPPGQAIATAGLAVERFLDTAVNWLSDFPANPITDFLAGAVWLVRRDLFPVGSAVGSGGPRRAWPPRTARART